MKKKISLFVAALSLLAFSAVAFAKPDFNKPAEETGILQLLGDDDFYINGYELDDLSKAQERQLYPLVGKTVTIKGFYEKEYKDYPVDEIYVTEIIAQ